MTAFTTFLALQLARLTTHNTNAVGEKKPDLEWLDGGTGNR